MGAVYNLLAQTNKCLDERDFLDGLTDENVIKLVPAGNINRTDLIHNSSQTPDVVLIIGITILIVAAAVVIVLVSIKVNRNRRGISNDVAFGLDFGGALLS